MTQCRSFDDGGTKMNLDKITIPVLMDIFNRVDSSFRLIRTPEEAERWRPTTEAEMNAFNALIATGNRDPLRAWYASTPRLTPKGELFRQTLERIIKEPLPRGEQ